MTFRACCRLLLVAACLTASAGCTRWFDRCAGYGPPRPPVVVDPRGVPLEPPGDVRRIHPGCGDTNACYQCRLGRETFFDSLYALFCERNCWNHP